MLEFNAHDNICLGNNCRLYDNVCIDKYTFIGDNVIIGYPKEIIIEQLQRECRELGNFDINAAKLDKTIIGESCRIGPNVVIYSGTRIGNSTSIEDFCRIGFDCEIGCKSILLYRAHICDRVRIGNNCRIAGFVCDGASIGNDTTTMGSLVHKYKKPKKWGLIEDSPEIGDKVVIGYDAKIVGGLKIGNNSYIGAGAVVTRDVPPRTMVIGINQFASFEDWRGCMKGKYFWRWGYETPD